MQHTHSPLDGAGQVVTKQGKLESGGNACKTLAGHMATAKCILALCMHKIA